VKPQPTPSWVRNVIFRPSPLFPRGYLSFTVSCCHFYAFIFTFQVPCFISFPIIRRSTRRSLRVPGSLASAPKQSNSKSISARLMRRAVLCRRAVTLHSSKQRRGGSGEKSNMITSYCCTKCLSGLIFEPLNRQTFLTPSGIICVKRDRRNIAIQLKRDISHFRDSYMPQRPQFWVEISEQQIILTLIV
jgi:hypothetical protein